MYFYVYWLMDDFYWILMEDDEEQMDMEINLDKDLLSLEFCHAQKVIHISI